MAEEAELMEFGEILENTPVVEKSSLDGKKAFLETLSQHFESGSFSDVTLIVGDKRYSTHKTILAASSPYFQRMFYGGTWKEGKNSEVKLEETPSCEEAFETFLSYFYSGSVSVTIETVVPVVTLADKYNVQGLKDICTKYMVEMLHNKRDVDAALGWVTFAEQMRMHALQQKCYDLICFDFDKACNLTGWLSLSLEQILTILKRSDIVVANELSVFQAVETWLLGHSVTEKIRKRVLSQVQFKNMNVEQLCKVEKSQLTSRDVCKENNPLTPYLYDAFRYVAVKNFFPNGDNKPAVYQRCYTASEYNGSLSTATFYGNLDGRCAKLTARCTSVSEIQYYAWELGKFGGSSKYQIRLPNVSRGYRTHRHSSVQYLYTALPGDICFKLILIIRDKDGRTIEAMNGSFVAQIPKENGKIIVEFPESISANMSSDDNPECASYDVMYSFLIEKVPIVMHV
ncbi:BTB/POZ domain-containing protein 17-like [Amphiura filiformis]|uniref:BTB/POZ domain-containing protein 17-like n=1 Tax=Amphiura filiformis TaxID=82378 RepID=UPI003B222104